MSVNLCIDWGNTSVKAGIFQDERLVEFGNFSADEAKKGISDLIENFTPVKAIFCSVVRAEHTNAIEEMVKGKVKAYMVLDGDSRLPIMSAYTAPETLGADRLALSVGAWALHTDKNTLVVNLGTCITYNFTQKNKTFRGGAISPGLQMRLKAMHEFAEKLPLVRVDGELLLIGYDTQTCIRSGAVYGMVAEIDGIVNEYASQYQDFNAVLTGGDAPFFAGKLKSKIFADPQLLLRGLNLILNHNVSIPR
ncbi:MAG: type III pantothenate kinase [Taibaiella sp.]|nr:type III pantothenate kinase [Taibaiella sp.]